MAELRPCPFCGGEADYHRFANPINFFSIRCKMCRCGTDGFILSASGGTDAENKRANADTWNRRAAPVKEVEGMQASQPIKCSECTYYYKGCCSHGINDLTERKPNDYCSYGERSVIK